VCPSPLILPAQGQRDQQKYEAARRLKGVVGEIRSQYRADWTSPDVKKRQRAVALYFIDKVWGGLGTLGAGQQGQQWSWNFGQ
jgi:DNA topoisomerase IB